MIAVLIIGLFFLVIAGLTSATLDFRTSRDFGRLEQQQAAQAAVLADVQRYQRETGDLPSSLKFLAGNPLDLANYPGVPGYAHLRSYVSSTNGGLFPGTKDLVWVACQGRQASATAACQARAVTGTPATDSANTYSDGSNRYARAAVVSQFNNSDTQASFLTTGNSCGSSTFADTSSNTWCGASDLAVWSRVETHDTLLAQRARITARLKASGDKFVSGYKAVTAFPGTATSTALYTLVTSVSGSTAGPTASVCSGSFYITVGAVSVALECSDLYNELGYPVFLQRPAAAQMRLSSALSYLNTAGAQVAGVTATCTPTGCTSP